MCLGIPGGEVLDLLEASPDNPALGRILFGFLSKASSTRGSYTPAEVDEIVKWVLFRHLAGKLSERVAKTCDRLRLSMD